MSLDIKRKYSGMNEAAVEDLAFVREIRYFSNIRRGKRDYPSQVKLIHKNSI